MKQFFLVFILAIVPFLLFSQAKKRFVGVVEYSGFSAVNDSTYRGDLASWSDPLTEGYLPSGIQVGYWCIDATGNLYTVTVINSTTFGSANVDLVEQQDDNAPIGAGAVFDPLSNGMIPPAVTNAAGITPVVRSKIDINNVVIADEDSGGSAGGAFAFTVDTLTAGGTTMVVEYAGDSTLVLAEPSAGNYTLEVPVNNQLKSFYWSGDNNDTDGSGDLLLDVTVGNNVNSYPAYQVVNGSNNQLADLSALGIVITLLESSPGAIATTLTSMSGFGASGWTVLARF